MQPVDRDMFTISVMTGRNVSKHSFIIMADKGSSWQNLDKGLVARSLTSSLATALKSLSSRLHMSSVSEKGPRETRFSNNPRCILAIFTPKKSAKSFAKSILLGADDTVVLISFGEVYL